MFSRSFQGGIHPDYSKYLSKDLPIKRLDLPDQVTIPLVQHIGAICHPVVKTGDQVKAGTLIAESEKLISAKIHSSISGKVKAIKKADHPVIGSCNAIIIESDKTDEKEPLAGDYPIKVEEFTPQNIIDIIKQAGIVGMGGAGFPTHVKLTPSKGKTIDTFILNGAECEPYLTCDDRMMQEHAKEVLLGSLLIMKAVGVKKGVIAIEDNKPKALKAMSDALVDLDKEGNDIEIVSLHTKYPQGGEKQLIKALTNREVPPAKLPFDVGCIVDNVQTAYAIYEAVYNKKPLYERVLTVTGDAIGEPANLRVRIGTPISYIIEKSGGEKTTLGKLINGGPMMGIAQYVDSAPVIKGTSGILLLSKKQVSIKEPDPCIRCGICVEACPMNLMPTEIAKAAEYGKFDIANNANASDCMECGCCSYVCPANIELVHLIKHAKRSIQCDL